MTYGSPAALRAALEHRLQAESQESGVALNRLRRRVAFERIVSRIESAEPGRWVVKGGMASKSGSQTERVQLGTSTLGFARTRSMPQICATASSTRSRSMPTPTGSSSPLARRPSWQLTRPGAARGDSLSRRLSLGGHSMASSSTSPRDLKSWSRPSALLCAAV
jgi:hypothetical protein